MKIKMHRGSLAGAMETVQQIDPTPKAVRSYLASHGIHEASDVSVDVSVRHYSYDARIRWNTYLVTVAGLGVIAMTDGPIN